MVHEPRSSNTPVPPRGEGLLRSLVAEQYRAGFISAARIQALTAERGLTRAHIEGVIDFYSFLHLEDVGRFRILFSDNIIERMQGNRALAEHLCRRLGSPLGEVRADGRVSIDYTSCIGMSDQGPSLLVNGHAIPSLDVETLDRIASRVEANTPLTEWPQEWFEIPLNIRKKGLLLANEHGDGDAVNALLSSSPTAILAKLEGAGLRGRGGAGFATAAKWRLCRDAPVTQPNQRVVICNADEGEPGTFKDRVLLQGYAERLFDGMTLCAGVIGADRGIVYLRGEYRYLLAPLQASLERRRRAGLLGRRIGGRAGFDFEIEIELGAGAYICGEESSLIESLEGKRGNPRNRPPFPVTRGYLGRPTVINNVATFIAAAMIAAREEGWFRGEGTEQSSGSKLLSIAGDCDHPGVYEYPFGTPIDQILEACGTRQTQAVQIAGAAGHLLPPAQFDRTIAFEDVATGGSFMIFNESRDLLEVVRNFADFFAHESCGFCTPCRVGTTLIQQNLTKIGDGRGSRWDLETLRRIGALMRNTSQCGLGATAPSAMFDLLDHFEVVDKRLHSDEFEPAFDLDAALQEARQATGRDDPGAHL